MKPYAIRGLGRSLLLSLTVLTAGMVIPCGVSAGGTTSPASAPAYKVVVDGLACPFCAYGIEKQLRRISGVQDVQTDIASETVTVTMAPGAELSKASAAQAVKDAGFTLHDFRAVKPANH